MNALVFQIASLAAIVGTTVIALLVMRAGRSPEALGHTTVGGATTARRIASNRIFDSGSADGDADEPPRKKKVA